MSKSSRDGWNSMVDANGNENQPRECVCGRRVTRNEERLWFRRFPVPQTFGPCCWERA